MCTDGFFSHLGVGLIFSTLDTTTSEYNIVVPLPPRSRLIFSTSEPLLIGESTSVCIVLVLHFGCVSTQTNINE